MGTCEVVEPGITRDPPHPPSIKTSDPDEVRQPETHEMVESSMTQKPTHPPSFHIANIQNLTGNGPFVKKMEKIKFLQDQCEEEKPYFLGFAETCLKNCIKEAEIEIKGYSHETSNRINRDGGGVIVYIRNDLTYQMLISTSDEMCSMVAIHINELNLVVFMVYRPPPNNKSQYHGENLIRSFNEIVIKNIHKVMSGYKSPTPDNTYW